MQSGHPERAITLNHEFARRLGGVSPATLWRLRRSDPDFPKTFKIGRHRCLLERDGEAYLKMRAAKENGVG